MTCSIAKIAVGYKTQIGLNFLGCTADPYGSSFTKKGKQEKMIRSRSILATVTFAAIAVLASSGAASAHTVFDTGSMITVKGETRAVKVDVGGDAFISLNKVSDPGVQVRVVSADTDASVSMRINAPGENGCSAEDNVLKGTLNRTITVRDGVWAELYVKVWYTTTTPAGLSWVTVLEPFGPTGMPVAGLGLFVEGVPVGICVA